MPRRRQRQPATQCRRCLLPRPVNSGGGDDEEGVAVDDYDGGDGGDENDVNENIYP